jgi:hypothetical protein
VQSDEGIQAPDFRSIVKLKE